MDVMGWNNYSNSDMDTGYSNNYNITCSYKEEEEPKKELLNKEEIEAVKNESLVLKESFLSSFAFYDTDRKEFFINQYENKKLENAEFITEGTDKPFVKFVFETVNPYEDRKLFRSKTVMFEANTVNTLVGCNGCGKSTILDLVEYILKSNGLPYISFDNMEDGGTNGINSSNLDGFIEYFNTKELSEGEQILKSSSRFIDYTVKLLDGTIKRNDKYKLFRSTDDVFLLLDAIDSGYSIDNIINLKYQLAQLIELAKKNNRRLYIIAAANSYELVRDSVSWDVQGSKQINFKDYFDYAKFVLKTRKHILKQWEKQDSKKESDEVEVVNKKRPSLDLREDK